MRLEVGFSNLDEVMQFYDPLVVEKAARSTVRQLHNKAATRVNRAVRDRYNIKQRDITAVLKKRVVVQNGVPVGFLVYTSERISLRRFSSYSGQGEPKQNARPKVKSRAGRRRGARVRVVKGRKAHIPEGAFWGRGRAGGRDGGGGWHIFKRVGISRLGLKKLTGPAVAQMVRGDGVLEEINDLMRGEADTLLAKNLDFFLGRRAGVL